MLFAKVLFTACAGVVYACWLFGLWAVWHALPWWGFALVALFYLPPSTWLLYLAGMAVDRAKDEDRALPELSAHIAKLLWPIAAIHNCLNNACSMTALFLDAPKELATTKRLNRYADGPDGWRKTLALLIRDQLLNVFDWRGIHT